MSYRRGTLSEEKLHGNQFPGFFRRDITNCQRKILPEQIFINKVKNKRLHNVEEPNLYIK